jgi:hypothetical protein
MKANAGVNPLVPLMLGLWIIWGFGFETVGRRLKTKVDGVVISSRDLPSTGAPRNATHYTLRGLDGDSVYVAGPTDASLPRSLPIGTHLRKQRWHLDYERNGERVDDFPISFYSVTFGIAFSCLFWSFTLWRDRRQQLPLS